MRIYQSIVKHVLNPLDLWRSGDYAEVRYWQEFERTQFLPADELERLRWKRLKHILDLAYRKIPYYKASFDRADVLPSDINGPADMLALPVLEKRDLQANLNTLLNPDWPKDDLILDKTGGSTGTPVHYYYSKDRKRARQAGALRHDRWAGYEIGDAKAALWGAARDMPTPGWKQKIKALIFPKELLLNTVEMTPEIMLDFNEQLKRWRPPVILAYANAMALFAVFLKNAGVPVYSPRAVISSAEMLRPEDRTLIEDVFACPVFNRLGCREFSVIASECSEHDGMHIMAEGLHVEIVRNGQHVEPGRQPQEVGEILVTDILNEAMPLIRYRLGDTATWRAGTCACGRHLPRITGLAGRVTDFLVGLDGRFFSGVALATFIVAARPSLGQIQVIQEEHGKVLYRVGCGADKALSKEDFDYLQEETELYLGKGMKIDYEFVDSIPHEASGKFVFSKSKVAQEMFR